MADATIDLLKARFRQLRLPTMSKEFEKLARDAAASNLTFAEFLLALGEEHAHVWQALDEARLKAFGYGPDRPLVENDTDEHREQNRRVEFNIVKQGKKKVVVEGEGKE